METQVDESRSPKPTSRPTESFRTVNSGFGPGNGKLDIWMALLFLLITDNLGHTRTYDSLVEGENFEEL